MIYLELPKNDRLNLMLSSKWFCADPAWEECWRMESTKCAPKAFKLDSLSWKEHFKQIDEGRNLRKAAHTTELIRTNILQMPLCRNFSLIGDLIYIATAGKLPNQQFPESIGGP